ncbi:MAG TPA: hypothetical protein VIX37_24400, partial [Candidatus Sulfotelmatobacter sp.]
DRLAGGGREGGYGAAGIASSFATALFLASGRGRGRPRHIDLHSPSLCLAEQPKAAVPTWMV